MNDILPVGNRIDAVGEPMNKLAGKLLAVFFCEVILLILFQPTIDPLIDLPIIFRSFTDNLATKCTSPARGFEAIISENVYKLFNNYRDRLNCHSQVWKILFLPELA